MAIAKSDIARHWDEACAWEPGGSTGHTLTTWHRRWQRAAKRGATKARRRALRKDPQGISVKTNDCCGDPAAETTGRTAAKVIPNGHWLLQPVLGTLRGNCAKTGDFFGGEASINGRHNGHRLLQSVLGILRGKCAKTGDFFGVDTSINGRHNGHRLLQPVLCILRGKCAKIGDFFGGIASITG